MHARIAKPAIRLIAASISLSAVAGTTGVAAADPMSILCLITTSADGSALSNALEMPMEIDVESGSVLLFGGEAQSGVRITETSILWTRGDATFLIGRGSGSFSIQSISEPEKTARGTCAKSEKKF